MKTFCIMVLLPLLSAVFFGSAAAERQTTTAQLWNTGLTAARKGNTDTALSCLKRAFAGGLSDDSLYYLWAEVFLYRGVLDTALALNYSVKTVAEGGMHKLVLKQRHMIFTALGWKKEAEALLDSLGGRRRSLVSKLLPECNLYLTGGGYRENNVVDKGYPLPRDGDSTEILTNGNGIASLRFGWRIPVTAVQGVQFGGKLRFAGSRFSLASSAVHLDDSADASFGGYCSYSLFSDLLSLSYTFSRKRDFLDVKSFLHQFYIRCGILTNHWLGTVEAGYNYENPVREHYYYLMTWWDRMIGKRHDFSWMVFLSGMQADPFTVPGEVAAIYVNDGEAWDKTFSRRIFYEVEFVAQSSKIASSIPQSYWAINPTATYEYSLSKRISFGAGCGYTGNWYRENSVWIDYRYPIDEVPRLVGQLIGGKDYSLAYNSNDENYYWVRSTNRLSIGHIAVELDSLPVVFSRRRIDHAITLNLFLKSSLGRFGEVRGDMTLRRNFSNLTEYAPVDIERWYGAATLTWFFRFKPEFNR